MKKFLIIATLALVCRVAAVNAADLYWRGGHRHCGPHISIVIPAPMPPMGYYYGYGNPGQYYYGRPHPRGCYEGREHREEHRGYYGGHRR